MPRPLPLLVGLLLLATGCGSTVRQPTATLRAAKVAGASADGFRLNFDVDVGNPNGFVVPLSAAQYKLGLAGVTVVNDTAKPGTSIPANGSAPVTIPVALSFEQLLKAERGLVAGRGNVPYELDGVLEFAAGPMAALGQSVRVPVKFSGTLGFRDAIDDPVAFAKSPAGRRLIELLFEKNLLQNLLSR